MGILAFSGSLGPGSLVVTPLSSYLSLWKLGVVASNTLGRGSSSVWKSSAVNRNATTEENNGVGGDGRRKGRGIIRDGRLGVSHPRPTLLSQHWLSWRFSSRPLP